MTIEYSLHCFKSLTRKSYACLARGERVKKTNRKILSIHSLSGAQPTSWWPIMFISVNLESSLSRSLSLSLTVYIFYSFFPPKPRFKFRTLPSPKSFLTWFDCLHFIFWRHQGGFVHHPPLPSPPPPYLLTQLIKRKPNNRPFDLRLTSYFSPTTHTLLIYEVQYVHIYI